MIYLDYAASTPVEDDVLNNFTKVVKENFANPNSNHEMGFKSKKIVDDATENIAKYLNILPNEIIYTSGATESNNLVIKGICERYKNLGKHILLSSLEHNSLIAAATSMQSLGFEIELIDIDKDGQVDIDDLKAKLRDDTILVSVCSIDSELGIKQPIEEIANIIKQYPNCYFHTDASQSIGKEDVNFKDCDLVTITPHKFYGLSGIGILIKKNNVMLKPQIDGGKSTTVFRSGTPSVALISSSKIALEIAINKKEERSKYVSELHDVLVDKLTNYQKVHINSTKYSTNYIINFSIEKVKSNDFVKLLEKNNVYVSAKTSCCPVETPSKLVYALTKDKKLAATSIRLSLSHLTTKNEIDEFLSIFDKCYKEIVNGEV